MKNKNELKKLLESMDGKGYPAYKALKGKWDMDGFVLSIDHVQGDPFASPSSCSFMISGKKALFPKEYASPSHRRCALSDALLRKFSYHIKCLSASKGSGKSGMIFTDIPGQEILERSALMINPQTMDITASFEVGFPANGRRINASPLIDILTQKLPGIVRECFLYSSWDHKKLEDVIYLSDDQKALRDALIENDLIGFIADGAVLPRESGISQKPMKDAIPFKSPKSLSIVLNLPHKGNIRGMGIKRGITVIIGGGYHGKSTLLNAIESGIYDHIDNDGRQLCVTDNSAVKCRSEDGRRISGCDISLFIKKLPNGKDTSKFYSDDASGSTSQAASMVEAIESGAKTILLDEDTCAANLMVRDNVMQSVVSKDDEPIIPFSERIRPIYESFGISTVMVAGSSGQFFASADTVIRMDSYVAYDATKDAKNAADKFALTSSHDEKIALPSCDRILIRPKWLDKESRIKTKVFGKDLFSIGKDEVNLRAVEQIMNKEQATGIMLCVKEIFLKYSDGKKTVSQCLDELEKDIKEKGFYCLFPGTYIRCGAALVRRHEILAAIYRHRTVTIK